MSASNRITADREVQRISVESGEYFLNNRTIPDEKCFWTSDPGCHHSPRPDQRGKD
jgi:hypothetical protein